MSSSIAEFKIMKVAICLRPSAYLPEAYAYQSYLNSKNVEVELVNDDYYGNDIDIKLNFLGFSFFSNYKRSFKQIHEYGSLSTPPFSFLKDEVKKYFNSTPDARIFLNPRVHEKFNFINDRPFMYRDMGIDKLFFCSNNAKKVYDVVYCGGERIGLMENIDNLLKFGLKIIVVGSFSASFNNHYRNVSNITFTGKLNRVDISKIYQISVAGLNYTPNIFPYNIQTSTKTLEYCAAGLNIISNQYEWVDQFVRSYNSKFLWIQNIKSRSDIESFNYITPDVSNLEWDYLLDKLEFDKFLFRICGE